MAMVLPGVSFSETLLSAASDIDAVTMPLFIGYLSADAALVSTPTEMEPYRVDSLLQATYITGGSGTLYQALRHFFENSGQCCYLLSLGQKAPEPTTRLPALITALQSDEVREAVAADNRIGLLLVPEMSELNDLAPAAGAGSKADSAIDVPALWYQGWQALLQLCAPGARRFALLEAPEEPDQALALTQQSFSADLCQNGAAWWPRLETPYENEPGVTAPYRLLSPLPAVAAAIQRSAREQGVWKAPANIQLAKTIRPSKNIFLAQSLLNQNGVSTNLIRSFAGSGVRLWGCRTLLNDAASPWRYIQTRLLVNSVEQYMSRLARAYLFEPNDARTWMKLKGQAWTWLRQQWLEGAFYGTSEEEAFNINIGLNETMTAEDISNGHMILHIQLALLAPAEFIDISLTLDARGSSAAAQSRRR